MRRNKKSLLFLLIHSIKVSLLFTQTSADKPQKYSLLFFAFYHFLCYTYLVWDWCWSFRFAQPDLFRTYRDSQTGNFCYTYRENVLFSSHDAIIGNRIHANHQNYPKNIVTPKTYSRFPWYLIYLLIHLVIQSDSNHYFA